MKKAKAFKFIVSIFITLNLSGLYGQSSLKTIKFMNCEWGISPEEAIAALQQESVDINIKENINLKYEDKAIGMREFVTHDFLFAGHKWRLKLIFLDNKLANVLLSSSNADKLKTIRELEAKFGEYKTDITYSEIWEAKDGSQLSLRTPINKIIISYYAPGFWEEYQKRKNEASGSQIP